MKKELVLTLILSAFAITACAGQHTATSSESPPVVSVAQEGSSAIGENDPKAEAASVFRYPFWDRVSVPEGENSIRFGYIDEHGTIAIAPQFEFAWQFESNIAPVIVDETSYWINMQGETIYDETYLPPSRYCDGLRKEIIERQGNLILYGYFKANGEEAFRVTCYSAQDFSEGFAAIEDENHKLTYLNTKGEPAISTNYDFHDGPNGVFDMEFHRFFEGVAVIHEDQPDGTALYGYIDQTGKIVIAPQFLTAHPFYEGMAKVRTKNGTGFINHQGDLVIPDIFENAGNFSEGIACVMKKNQETGFDRVGFINKQGDLVIDYIYKDFYSTYPGIKPSNTKKNGLIQVQHFDEGWRGYIDDTGNVIFKID